MARMVYAKQNDTLDSIVYRYFGKTLGLVEHVLELNPTLANLPILAIGTVVILPNSEDIQTTTNKNTLSLWD
ncbi:tail protein X [Histophilus somni]|uniref:Phage tail protein n=1 Tax=Histophilus somni TaxID=731 RepID=Q48280_HISSO|nr:tail protein X [Histophilus somni]AAC45161.1 putative tail synthesis protein [Histophilus somni]ACA30887.1 phage tail X family protein [Histophilus somni 2336]MBB5151597.1 phage tail protein X [Histophilus somni]TDF37026.1 phage tail protein [Histophilus somni]TEW26969.1 phage tail protein [Histophilus somni]